MNIVQIPLKKCKLWWPAWQQGIPFTSYGYSKEVSGDGYQFNVDPEVDSWLCPNGELMPISTSTLKSSKTSDTVLFTSFTIAGDEVQVNYLRDKASNGYLIRIFKLDELYFEGEAYSEDD